MTRVLALWLLGTALFVMPVAADEDVYDGPTAIKPLTVTPQPPRPAAPDIVCDYEHQCYPAKGGLTVPSPAARATATTKPAAPRSQDAISTADDSVVAAWRSCVDRALQNYQQSHDLYALQSATLDCQMRLEAHKDANFAGLEPPASLTAPPQMGGRRNIGCGWWPIGSDADRDCAIAGRRF